MGPDTDDPSVFVIHLASQQLPNGLYKVNWKAECVDGHKTAGSFAYDAMK
jgi:methionine-rich copper-binding protein CopC